MACLLLCVYQFYRIFSSRVFAAFASIVFGDSAVNVFGDAGVEGIVTAFKDVEVPYFFLARCHRG